MGCDIPRFQCFPEKSDNLRRKTQGNLLSEDRWLVLGGITAGDL